MIAAERSAALAGAEHIVVAAERIVVVAAEPARSGPQPAWQQPYRKKDKM